VTPPIFSALDCRYQLGFWTGNEGETHRLLWIEAISLTADLQTQVNLGYGITITYNNPLTKEKTMEALGSAHGSKWVISSRHTLW